MTLSVRLSVCAILWSLCSAVIAADELPGEKIEATTATGEKVVLHPNGRWEYMDADKAKAAKEIAQQYPENQVCPPGWRGGLMGIGRCVPPTDKDFNRGSMIGK
jgi:hypothetical protein